MIITIDGAVGTGKSTVAKKLAEKIGYIYFDTGAMYRAFTYALVKNRIDLDKTEHVQHFLKSFDFDIKIHHNERQYLLNGEDVTEHIRGSEVTALVSKVSALRPVRDKLVSLQRHLAIGVNAVFEGRDMGTVVFPDARLKIYLTGRPEVRAKRRYLELRAKFPEETKTLTIEQTIIDIEARDQYDMTREISPLHQATDAHIIDTSDLTIDEVVEKILDIRDTLRTKKDKSK